MTCPHSPSNNPSILLPLLIKIYTVNQGCMSLSTYHLEYGHLVALLRRRRRSRAYAPTSAKINARVFFPIWVWGSAQRPFAITQSTIRLGDNELFCFFYLFFLLLLVIPLVFVPLCHAGKGRQRIESLGMKLIVRPRWNSCLPSGLP